MGNNAVSDKLIVRNLIVGCIAVILIFHFAWFGKFLHNLSNAVFDIFYGLLIGVFIVEAIGTYRYADDDSKDWKRKFLLAISVVILLWLGGWAAGSNEKKMFEDDVKKAKGQTMIRIVPPGECEFENRISFMRDINGIQKFKVQRFGATLIIDKTNINEGDNKKLVSYLLNHCGDHDPDILRTISFRIEKNKANKLLITGFHLVGEPV